ncbi:hypothetical protein LINGRAHAP2_LOCUS19635, partial [Linum grandiflorum]
MVRSIYRLVFEGLGTLPHLHVAGLWKKLWNTPIQLRVKQLICRISRNAISNEQTCSSEESRFKTCVVVAHITTRRQSIFSGTVLSLRTYGRNLLSYDIMTLKFLKYYAKKKNK